tara:strand:+ start:94 stop:360 length:267 start_codon:yes stop_codon:yes gene_type:complete
MNVTNNECIDLLNKICDIYNLDKMGSDEYISNMKKNNKNKLTQLIDSDLRCLGIIKSGTQCLRARHCNNDFCKIHQKTLKFGKKFYVK